MTEAPTYVLVVEDFSGRASEDDLFARLGPFVVAVERTSRTDRGRTIPGMRITLRSGFSGLRNTVAHAMGVGTGFITHVEYD